VEPRNTAPVHARRDHAVLDRLDRSVGPRRILVPEVLPTRPHRARTQLVQRQ